MYILMSRKLSITRQKRTYILFLGSQLREKEVRCATYQKLTVSNIRIPLIQRGNSERSRKLYIRKTSLTTLFFLLKGEEMSKTITAHTLLCMEISFQSRINCLRLIKRAKLRLPQSSYKKIAISQVLIPYMAKGVYSSLIKKMLGKRLTKL